MRNEFNLFKNGFFQDVLSPLASLEVFHVMEKYLTDLPDKLFQGQKVLRELKVKGDQIQGFRSELFSNLTSLTSLQLVNMNFSQDGLKPGVFDSLTGLTNFSLTGPGLALFPETVFSQNKNLQRLEFAFFSCSPSKPPCRVSLPKFARNISSLQVGRNCRSLLEND